MKKTLLAALLLTAGLSAQAQTYSYLTIEQNGGDQTSFAADGLKITFSDGNMIVKSGADQTTYALSSLSKMFFAIEATGLTEAATADEAYSAVIADGHLKVTAPAGTPVSVYATDGRQVSAAGRFDKGIYVVRMGNRSAKVIAR